MWQCREIEEESMDMKDNAVKQFYLIVFFQVCCWEGVKWGCGAADTLYTV
jgi:hypothetical protein